MSIQGRTGRVGCVCVTPLDARFGNLFSERELLMIWWKTSLVDKLIENCGKMYQKNSLVSRPFRFRPTILVMAL